MKIKYIYISLKIYLHQYQKKYIETGNSYDNSSYSTTIWKPTTKNVMSSKGDMENNSSSLMKYYHQIVLSK